MLDASLHFLAASGSGVFPLLALLVEPLLLGFDGLDEELHVLTTARDGEHDARVKQDNSDVVHMDWHGGKPEINDVRVMDDEHQNRDHLQGGFLFAPLARSDHDAFTHGDRAQ